LTVSGPISTRPHPFHQPPHGVPANAPISLLVLRIVHPGGDACPGAGAIPFGAGIEKERRATSRYNRNIVIEDNVFRTFGSGPLVQMYSVDGLAIRGNRVESTEAYPVKLPGTKRFDVVESENVSVSE
jgi:hypothetical protein